MKSRDYWERRQASYEVSKNSIVTLRLKGFFAIFTEPVMSD